MQLVEQVEDIAPPGFVGVHRVERSGDVLRRDLSQELEATSADHRRDPARLVRVIGVPLSHQRRPLDLRRIDVCDLDLGCSPRLRKEVHRAPIPELGHGGRGDGPHQLAVIPGRDGAPVDLCEELESLPKHTLASHRVFGLCVPARRFELESFAGRDVRAAPDRAGDVAVGVERHGAAALKPMHRAVAPDHPMLDLICGLVGDRALESRERVLHVVGMDQRDPALERAVEGAGFEPEDPLHRRVPLGDTRCYVPPPRAQLACGEREHEVLAEIGRALLDDPER